MYFCNRLIPDHIVFLCFSEVELRNILNMDETPMYFDMAHDTTYAPIGAKDVAVSTTGYSKLRFTVVLTISAAGRRHKPMIIFKNLKNIPKLKSGQKWPEGNSSLSF